VGLLGYLSYLNHYITTVFSLDGFGWLARRLADIKLLIWAYLCNRLLLTCVFLEEREREMVLDGFIF